MQPDGTAKGFGEDSFAPEIWDDSESFLEDEGEYGTCPICLDPIDYCPGHGTLG